MGDRIASAPVRAVAAAAAMLLTVLITSGALAQTPASPAAGSKAQPKWSAPVAKSTPAKRAASCSAYGEGFVNVPGTDTCIKLGGYLRSEAGVSR
jgi:hypothetical protein